MKIYNIMWDIDYYEEDNNEIMLPTKLIIPNMDIDEVADWLSDEYGFCVQGFNIENEN